MVLALALASAGKSIPARIAMMAMTTSNSMSVKATVCFFRMCSDCIDKCFRGAFSAINQNGLYESNMGENAMRGQVFRQRNPLNSPTKDHTYALNPLERAAQTSKRETVTPPHTPAILPN